MAAESGRTNDCYVPIMAPWPIFVVAGAAIGLLTGLFGVGGSSIATPLLAILGVPPLLAVASPLPATIPAALAAAPYIRTGEARPRAATWSLVGALPATVLGALCSNVVGGPALLIASGIVLVIVGQRVLRPIEETARRAGTLRRKNRPYWSPRLQASGCSPDCSPTAEASCWCRCTC